MKLKNTTFIFDSSEDLIDFWNETVGKLHDSEIMYNTFIVRKRSWFTKFLIKLLSL